MEEPLCSPLVPAGRKRWNPGWEVLTCGSRPRLDPPPTATTGSPVCADTNSSMGARGARLGGGGLSSSKTNPCKVKRSRSASPKAGTLQRFCCPTRLKGGELWLTAQF